MKSSKEIEYVGYWWLPQYPEQKIVGTMIFHSEGIDLELFVSFSANRNLNINDDSHSIILGVSKDGQLLTCYKASIISCTFSTINIIKYRIDLAFIGVHFSQDENIKFHRFIIEYTYLPDFVYTNQPKFLKAWNEEINDNINCPNHVVKTPKLEAKTPDAIISINPNKRECVNFFKTTIEKYAQVSIKLVREELSFIDFYNKYLYPLQNFLSLATNRNNFITKIYTFSYCGTFSNSNRETNVIEILAPFIHEKKSEMTTDMLFSLKDIEDEFALYIQKWLNITEEIQHICNVYFGVKYARQNIYGESEFLHLIQILESYHRIKIRQDRDGDEAHNHKLDEIYKSCPSEYLDWLKGKLKFSYELSLQERLEEITQTYRETIKPLVKNERAFITKIKDNRNYYTHYNQSLKAKVASGEELFRISQVLSYIIQSCLLNELGCTPERCADLMRNNNEYNYAIAAIKKANFQW